MICTRGPSPRAVQAIVPGTDRGEGKGEGGPVLVEVHFVPYKLLANPDKLIHLLGLDHPKRISNLCSGAAGLDLTRDAELLKT